MLARWYSIDYTEPEADENKYQTLYYLVGALAQGGAGIYHSRVVRRTVVRFWPPNCIEPRAKHSLLQISLRDQVKNFSLLHAEIFGTLATFYVVRREVNLGRSCLAANSDKQESET